MRIKNRLEITFLILIAIIITTIKTFGNPTLFEKNRTQDTLLTEIANLKRIGDSLLMNYEFTRARLIFETIQKRDDKADIEQKLINCKEGEKLIKMGTTPQLLTKKRLNRKDFFLYYPQISLYGDFYKVGNDTLFVPKESNEIYFSIKSVRGDTDIYYIQRKDSTWSEAKVLNNNVVTQNGNELYPILSPDKKSLYFSSNGHNGLGGYDLFVSHWDEDINDWGIAQNLGLPYSSPSNDLFFYITKDNKYAVFSSDRDFYNRRNIQNGNNLTTYVLENKEQTEHQRLTSQQARELAQLRFTLTGEQLDSLTKAYIDNALFGLSEENFNYSQDSVRQEITQRYIAINQEVRMLKKGNQEGIDQTTERIKELQKEIKKIEDDFLNDNEFFTSQYTTRAQKDKKESTTKSNSFSIEDLLNNKAEVKMPQSQYFKDLQVNRDLSFCITKDILLASKEDMPNGLVYQIRFLSSNMKSSKNSFKGLSPVFERESGGRFYYNVGVFFKYEEALEALEKVKEVGFTTAQIVAYENDKLITLAVAKRKEKNN